MLIVLQDLNSVHNSADEMEMYAAVNRKFHAIFNRQEIMKTFKTYDRLEVRLINIPQRKHEFDTGRFFKKITKATVKFNFNTASGLSFVDQTKPII